MLPYYYTTKKFLVPTNNQNNLQFAYQATTTANTIISTETSSSSSSSNFTSSSSSSLSSSSSSTTTTTINTTDDVILVDNNNNKRAATTADDAEAIKTAMSKSSTSTLISSSSSSTTTTETLFQKQLKDEEEEIEICTKPNRNRNWPYRETLPSSSSTTNKYYVPSYKYWDYTTHRVKVNNNSNNGEYRKNDTMMISSFEILERIINLTSITSSYDNNNSDGSNNDNKPSPKNITIIDIESLYKKVIKEQQQSNNNNNIQESKQIFESCFKANLTRSYELIQKYKHCRNNRHYDSNNNKIKSYNTIKYHTAAIGGPSYPIINLGFPKIGTSSLYDFFKRCSKYTSSDIVAHSPTTGRCMYEVVYNNNNSSPLLNSPLSSKCMLNRKIQCQIDWYNLMPQFTLLDEIHYSEPNATFVLEFRPMIDWIKSAKAWRNMRYRWDKNPQPGLLKNSNKQIPVLTNNNKQEKENNDTGKKLYLVNNNNNYFTDTDIAMWFCRHITRIREFVNQYPTHDLIEIDIYDTKTTTEILSTLFGSINKNCTWGQSNAKASLLT